MAQAQNSFVTFEWKKNSSFTLQFLYNGKATEVTGNLREDPEGKPVEVQVVSESGFTLNLKAFPEGAAYAIVSEQFDDLALVFLMERQVGFYSSMNAEAIQTFKISAVSDLNGTLEYLTKLEGWDATQGMRSTAKYFTQNPSIKLSAYRNAIESGEIAPPPLTPTVAPSVVDGVVEMPDPVTRPPKLDIDEPALEPSVLVPDEPLDLSGGDFLNTDDDDDNADTKRKPKFDEDADLGSIADEPDFVPLDMTEGWDGDEGN